MTSKKTPFMHLLRILLSVMLGLMCALFAVIASNILFILWDALTGLPDAGSTGSVIFDLQRLAIFLVFAALAGVLSILNLNYTKNDVLISGAVAGGSMAVLLILPLVLLMQDPASIFDLLYTSMPPYLMLSSVAEYTDSFSQNLDTVVGHAWLAVLFLFVAAVAVAAGAAYYSAYHKQGKLGKDVGSPAKILGLLTLVVLVIPLVIAVAGVGAGIIPHPTSINYVAITTVDESGGNSTLSVELVGSPGARYLDKGKPFTILVDGREATNQSVADESRLNVRLDPPAGLGYEAGSKLKIRGLSLASKVEIIANFSDGVSKSVLSV
ncbi:hypothetical protein [Methanocella sp. MCL-LM]|uniref:hypothetical protein n=1 Tax=Methanocella sp. MCL-LM TaxID=3412035 RepID=UPI003C71992B